VCCVDHEERCNLGVRDDTQVSDSELIFLFLILVFFSITLLLITPRQCFILFQFSFLEKATFSGPIVLTRHDTLFSLLI
jgi:hypothetical protein